MKKQKKKQRGTESVTPFDDIFRTMTCDCKKFLIPLVNEIFKKTYDLNTPVILDANEYFITKQDGEQEKRITDSNFFIGDEGYQIECQSREDGSMMIRIWEYGSQIALRNSEYDLETNTLYLTFPNTAVLYLRSNQNTPDITTIQVAFPGQTVTYSVPNVKIAKYSIDDIFEKKLYFFIPFHLFVYEQNFPRYNDNKEELVELEGVCIELFNRLNAIPEEELTEYEKATIKDLFKKSMEHLTQKYCNIKKGLGDVMGGKILEYEAKRIKTEGKIEGKIEGETHFATLMQKLFELGRIADAQKAAADEQARKEFYREFGIID